MTAPISGKILPVNSLVPLLLALGLTLSGCQSVYYEAMEKMGTHKRDILVDRVEDGKEAQEEAKAQFSSAFDEGRGFQSGYGGS